MSATIEQDRRKLLLNLKCLVWCLHQMSTRYNLNLVLYSLEHHVVHPEILDSNLGDNLHYLMNHLGSEDLSRVSAAIARVSQTLGSLEIDEKHFEMGHYIQAAHDFGPIREGSYGIISSVTPQLRGLFCMEDGHLIESVFDPEDARTIFGTFIV